MLKKKGFKPPCEDQAHLLGPSCWRQEEEEQEGGAPADPPTTAEQHEGAGLSKSEGGVCG